MTTPPPALQGADAVTQFNSASREYSNHARAWCEAMGDNPIAAFRRKSADYITGTWGCCGRCEHASVGQIGHAKPDPRQARHGQCTRRKCRDLPMTECKHEGVHEMKSYHLSDILSISTGRLVSTRHIDGVYDILGYMCGEQLYTHQLGRVADEALPYLLEQMPWLRDIEHDHVNEDNWQAWLADLIEQHGEYHDVRPMHAEDHEVIDPREEALRMIGPNVRLISHNMDTGKTTVHDDD